MIKCLKLSVKVNSSELGKKKERERERKKDLWKKLETEKGPGLPHIKNYNARITKCGSDTWTYYVRKYQEKNWASRTEIQVHIKS